MATDFTIDSGILGNLDFSDVYNQAFSVANPYDAFSGIVGIQDPSQGQGNISNIRHGVGTALGRDVIAGWLNPSSIETGDPNLLARAAGTGGAWLGGAAQEIGDAWRSYRKGTPNWYVQPWEDILANTMGLRKTGYYTSPRTKALNLAGVYAGDTGIMNTILQNLSKDVPGAITQKDLQLAAEEEAARKAAGASTPSGGGGRDQWQQREERVQRERAKYRDTAKTGAKAGYTYGLQKGGVVSLMDLLNRRV